MNDFRDSLRKYRTPILWVVIAIYTWILPQAIIIYRDLETRLGVESVGRIPLIAVIMIGLTYIIYGYRVHRNFRHVLYLIPSAAIALTIIKSEPNPNKHIHIPEYILMAWLLYAALCKSYHGKGIFLLLIICGSMLGVVDELEQGLHPKRFYGWIDMIINSASTVIGALTIMGLTRNRRQHTNTWAWTKSFGRFKELLGLLVFGFCGAILLCIFLFQVHSTEIFAGVYPRWLLGWNGLYLMLLARVLLKEFQKANSAISYPEGKGLSTMGLWIYPPLIILSYMHIKINGLKNII